MIVQENDIITLSINNIPVLQLCNVEITTVTNQHTATRRLPDGTLVNQIVYEDKLKITITGDLKSSYSSTI